MKPSGKGKAKWKNHAGRLQPEMKAKINKHFRV
jgi:hypothetical protein